jgi:hypothetical protein
MAHGPAAAIQPFREQPRSCVPMNAMFAHRTCQTDRGLGWEACGRELLRLYSNRHSTPKRLREVQLVAVEECRDEDESRPRHVQVRLDPNQQADLVVAYNRGAPVADLARRYGVHRHTVTAHLIAHGVTPRRPGPVVPNAIPDACELYRAGWSLGRLGKRLGTTAKTVRKYLLLAGVEMRSPNERPSTTGARERT